MTCHFVTGATGFVGRLELPIATLQRTNTRLLEQMAQPQDVDGAVVATDHRDIGAPCIISRL